MFSVIIPVYRNAEFVPELIAAFGRIAESVIRHHDSGIEFVFVVDGSPDDSYALLRDALPKAPFASQLVSHSRNFGSFAAIRTGLQAARGDYFGIIAADLQEPPELLLSFLEHLVKGEHDIVIGTRATRDDPALTSLSANLFWRSKASR